MSLSKKINLREGEQLLQITRRYHLTVWWKYLFGFIIMAVASFFCFWLFSYGYWGYAVFGLCMLFGFYIIIRTWFFTYFNIFAITSERVVDIHRAGWLDVVISSVSHKDIKDVFVRKKGLLANLFNYGSVVIQSGSQQFLLEIIKVRNPQELQTLIQQTGEQYRRSRRLADTLAIYGSFIKIIPNLTDEQLREISGLINNELAPVAENQEDDF